MLLHTEAFTHSTQKLCTQRKIVILPQFLAIKPRFVRKGCGHLQIAILPQFLAIEPHFVQKGCAGRLELALYLSFWRSNLISCERVAPDTLKSHFYLSFWRSKLISCERVARDDLGIALLPQFLAIEPRFVRKGCAGQVEIIPQFLAIEAHFVRKGRAGRLGNRTFTSVFGDRTSFCAKGLRRTS